MQQGLHHSHHLHTGKRQGFEYFMYGVGILAPLSVLPQAIQVLIFQNSKGVSFVTWLLLGVVAFLWCIYGILHREKPIIITNAMFCILNFAVAFGTLLHS